MSQVKLEIPYLVKVVMNVITHADLKNLMKVNHKCEDALKCLKVNPLFSNHPSFDWFMKHFEVDTVDFHNIVYDDIALFESAKLIRNPSLSVFHKKGIIDEAFIKSIFPKIKRIRLLDHHLDESDDDEENSKYKNENETNEIIINNSKYFESLDYLEGDIVLIARFLENFTDEGKEIYIKMPKRIILNSKKCYAISFNADTVDLVRRIEKCIPDNDSVSVSIVVFEHVVVKEFLVPFKKVKYNYRCILSGMCEKFSECLFTENGKLWINGTMQNDDLNNVIEKAQPNTVLYRYIRDRTAENWNVPSCVETMVFDGHRIGFGMAPSVNICMDNVKYLTINNCLYILFDVNSLHSLKELTVQRSAVIRFEKIEFESLEKLTIESVKHVFFGNSEFKKLKNLKVIDAITCNIFSELACLAELNIIQCKKCLFFIESFENKKVYIEDCEEISFGSKDETENNPVSFCGIEKEKFDQTILNVFEFPLNNKAEGDSAQRPFKIRPFIPKSNRIIFEGKEMKRIAQIGEGEADMSVSSNFFTELNAEELFMFCGKNGDKEYLKDIRYFEIKVKGISFISIGFIDKQRYDKFEDRHVGWDKYSIGYHADDGCIFNGIYETIETHIPYGSEVGVEKVAGAGYNAKTEEAFFTCEGKLVRTVPVSWKNISAAIGCDLFNSAILNCGEEPFVFDLASIASN